MRWIITAFVLLAIAAPGARAQQETPAPVPHEFSTARLLQMCEGTFPAPRQPEVGVLACRSFLRGFMEFHAAALGADDYTPFCLPESGLTTEQLEGILRKAIRGDATLQGQHRALVLFKTLGETYPCEDDDA